MTVPTLVLLVPGIAACREARPPRPASRRICARASLRYGTVDRTGRMCGTCLRRTRVCDRRSRTRPTTAFVPVRFVHGATGPGWAEYACRSCAEPGPAGPGTWP